MKRGDIDLLDLTYGYQADDIPSTTGQLTNLIDNLDKKGRRAYEYDALRRLVTVQNPGLERPYWRMTYEYDRYGDRTKVAVSGNDVDGSEFRPAFQMLATILRLITRCILHSHTTPQET